ncbi:MAG TPA: GldG family protein [Candidatus Acidoferrales bacterium]|nr:GldG family protein [Candidatus Acidoferrales bacterium]
MKKRQTRYTAYASVYILVILAVLAAVNFLANRYDKSWDATSNKQFSLADQTIKVVRGLNRDVHITYFDESSRFQQARDLLDRYSSLSPKLHVDFVDPVKKPQQAKAAGYRRDLSILVDSGLRKEEAKSLSEEEVTGAVIRSLKSGERNACFVSGSAEHSLDDTGRGGYQAVKDSLEHNNYKTRTISLLTGAMTTPPPPAPAAGAAPAPAAAVPAAGKITVPADCTVLVVAGPQHDYIAPEADAIKAYVEGGGHALIMLDPPISLGREQTDDNKTLEAVLASWGVTVNQDLALDTSGIGQVFGLGPEVPLVAGYESHAIVREMKDVATAFPLSRTLEVKNGDKTTVEKLFSTSANSYATTDLKSGSVKLDPKKDKKGPLLLAAAGTYNGTPPGRFVVVGSSLWVGNNFIRFNGNRDMFLNMINWLTADEDLISIRPKSPEDRPLNLSPQKLNTVWWLSVVLFPLAVVGFGLATWWKRR